MSVPASPLLLLPVDGSDSALRAAAHCAQLAKALGARVAVLNVQPVIEDWQTHGIGREAAEAHLGARARAATAGAERALQQAGIAFETLVEFGDAPTTIAQVASARGCAGVVMGTSGQTELKSRLLGAVGTKVIHLVQVPVTFVH